jgi:hypothetical protein
MKRMDIHHIYISFVACAIIFTVGCGKRERPEQSTPPVAVADQVAHTHDTPREFTPTVLEQEVNGITIQIEKVTVDRVYNEVGYLQRSDTQWEAPGRSHPSQFWRSFRIVRVFTTYPKGREGTKVVSHKLTFANGATGSAEGVSAYSPPMWQKRNPDIMVDPKALGEEYWIHLDNAQPTETLFPASLTITFTGEDGQVTEFNFDEIRI